VYAPVILMMIVALLGAAGVRLYNLLWPFLIIEAILVASSIKYRFDRLRRVERRTSSGRRHDDH
jgi:hypothetical protein